MGHVMVGSVPVWADEASGEVFVNPQDAQMVGDADDDESGAHGQGRLRRLTRRLSRLEGRRGRLMERMGTEGDDAAPADLYQVAAASGMVNENQYNGLGNVPIVASGTGQLTDVINRNLWGKSLVLDSDSPASISVTSITVAGLPINVGGKGTPMSMFATNSTRFGISFGRKLALTGQQFVVNLTNIDTGSGHNVQGGVICDEMNPYAMQQWMERLLLTAAVGYGV